MECDLSIDLLQAILIGSSTGGLHWDDFRDLLPTVIPWRQGPKIEDRVEHSGLHITGTHCFIFLIFVFIKFTTEDI